MDSVKWIRSLLMAGLVFFGLFFVGCFLGGDDDDEVTISLATDNATIVPAGQNIAIDGDVDANVPVTLMYSITSPTVDADKLDRVRATATAPGGNVEDWDLKDDAELKIIADSDACSSDDYVLTITATAGSATLSKMHTFTVNGIDCDGTPFTNTKTGQFYHIEGACKGSFDLLNGVEVSSGASKAESDMVNTDAAAATFTGSWTVGTGNTTTYAKLNTFDYVNATKEAAATAFTSGVNTVSNPVVDDIYIAKLRGQDSYAVIKITEVNAGVATCTDGKTTGNTGKITFEYKIN